MQAVTRRSIEWLLARCGATWITRNLLPRGTLILAYHNIVPHGEPLAGDSSLHLPQRQFARHLDIVLKTHEPIPLADALQPSQSRRPRVAFTFDDAYRGAVSVGVQELVRRGLPATIFVAPGFVGGASFWWDALVGLNGPGLSESERSRALHELGGRDDAIRRWALEAGFACRAVPEHAHVAGEEELHTAVKASGITLAAHSWSHPNLAALDPGEIRSELELPLEWLHQRFDAVLAWLAYPYGLYSGQVEQAVAEAGYQAALRIDGGWVPSHTNPPFSLPRLNVPADLSADGFSLRVSGFF